ncbi:MAG: cytochrome C assembly family protein [Magnetovibrionaceae bacterium]
MKAMVLNAAALLSLLPSSLAALSRPDAGRDGVFWLLLGVAIVGPLAWVAQQMVGGWDAGFSVAIWLTITATMILFALVSALTRHGWRLVALVVPYMVVLGLIATAFHVIDPDHVAMEPTDSPWVLVHIAVSVATYGLVTLAALAALSAALQERALKRRQPTPLTRLLPSVADAERLTVTLLGVAEAVLGLGLVSGIATLFAETGAFLVLDHKTVLTFLAFFVIGVLLYLHHRTGMRGRQATRWVMIGYLLLTLGYPGVKFVTDTLMATTG